VLRSLPNCVTAARGLLGPVVAWLLLWGDRPRAAFWVFTFAAFTDLFDGALAKRLGSDRRLGALLDPLADRLLGACTWIALVLVGWAPVWLVAPLLLRDLVVGIGWTLARRRGRVWQASRLGQVATSYEGASLGILLFHGPLAGIHWPSVGVVVGGCGLALSLASAVATPPPARRRIPCHPSSTPPARSRWCRPSTRT
jgi:phosphatidylglycerophosphate synthase